MSRLGRGVAVGLASSLFIGCATPEGSMETSTARGTASVTPTVIVGTPTCGDIGLYGDASSSTRRSGSGLFGEGDPVLVPLTSTAHATLTWFGYPAPQGNSIVVDFASGIPVDAVIVSARDLDGLAVSNFYAYPTAAMGDTNLVAPRTSFCDVDCAELVPLAVSFCFAASAARAGS